ncbi:hypothetical protein BR63_10895 [Thermanaerosceptrum fracticalcis]|uniref:Uncharacterized protein n=1 Tax=Thermanaerosceptrum fracticalcis TaxID=1712410 RepID=A0A7G6E3W5_THEFR|nr:CC/Se motif family (seleno)protein [Thermanaerosceptrum fracticalcis]QNB46769.1 hypothetical protein BR63_10895 [Thermanaerosceptrum fracticalcis]
MQNFGKAENIVTVERWFNFGNLYCGGCSQFIRQKGGNILIYEGLASGCCAGSVPEPGLELSKPRRNPENYQERQVGDITVYLDKALASLKGWAEITLTSVWRWKSLSFSYKED